MHTSGGGDVIDEYLETVVERDGKFFYKYGNEERAVRAVPITLPYKTPDGMASRTVTAYFTTTARCARRKDGKWVAVKMMDEPLKALMQSYGAHQGAQLRAFCKAMELRTNSSNNTVYADADGNIAYFHGNFIPEARSALRLDASGRRQRSGHRVAGPARRSRRPSRLQSEERLDLRTPTTGRSRGFGASSPRQADYPAYMWSLPENARGVHAERVLHDATGPDARQPDRGRLRQLPDRLRAAAARLLEGLRRAARATPLQARAGGAGRAAARLGPAFRWTRCRPRWPCTGARTWWHARAPREAGVCR
jgi:acyl-homoserine-lactone acylase